MEGEPVPNSKSFKPMYRVLADKIGTDIIVRKLKNGDFFCTLKDLCEQYGVSIITVRKAVSLLENNGILSCKSASGIYIANCSTLDTLSTFNRVVLIPHFHFPSQINVFFELRLSAILQTLASRGYLGHPLFREEMTSAHLHVFGDRVCGIMGGNSMAKELSSANNPAPLMLVNAPPEILPNRKLCVSRYDFRKLIELSREFIERKNPPKTIRIVTEPSFHAPDMEAEIFPGMRQIDIKNFSHVHTAIDTGRNLATELFEEIENGTFFWITDDYVALGFCEVCLKHGLDMNARGQILVNASPSLPVMEALRFPVIGFCPVQIGIASTSYFCDFLETPREKRTLKELLIQPSANSLARS